MIKSKALQKISSKLERYGKEHNCSPRLLYACEAGSRAWNFASLDSDYDIRFIWCCKTNDYLQINSPRGKVINFSDGNLDIEGWDIYKACNLFLTKSNGNLLEWLTTDMHYFRDMEFYDDIKEVTNLFSQYKLAWHYWGVAYNTYKQKVDIFNETQTKLKPFLYVIRSMCCCKWIIDKNTIPPLSINVLLKMSCINNDLCSLTKKLLELKIKTNESSAMGLSEVIFETIEGRLNALKEQIEQLPNNDNTKLIEKMLNRVILNAIGE